MPLGDSITWGVGYEEVEDDAYRVGYRHFLWQDLIGSGYIVDFVGSLWSGYGISGFDANHEGWGGKTAAYVATYIYQWLVDNPPDIVLLHIGTNDLNSGFDVETTISNVESILNNIDAYESAYNREVTVILAQIINRQEDNPLTSEFNTALYDLALTRQTAGDRLTLVDIENALEYPADMYDLLHPNGSGYAKMADVWLGALQSYLPLPTRLLTVQKDGSGQGRVTSIPDAVDCGISCSDSFLYGTFITLTATAEHGSAFSGWDGCDSVKGNTCSITLDSDRIVTVDFRSVTGVELLSPNGGEIIPVGSPQYPITWEAPPEAVTFKISYHPSGRRIGIVYSVNNIMWDVPLLKKNKKNAYVKVTAYNNANRKIGYDISDSEFTIEVVSITSPDQGKICTGGQVCTIAWTKSTYVPATSIELYYSLHNGHGWKKILDAPLPGDAEFFDWIAPNVSEPKAKCKVKVVLKDSDGKIVGSDVSEGSFTILP
jgi:lysophospholipase L1-like esterase